MDMNRIDTGKVTGNRITNRDQGRNRKRDKEPVNAPRTGRNRMIMRVPGRIRNQ